MLNWNKIKVEVETTKLPYRSIAKKYKLNHSTISKKVKKENWNVSHRANKKAPSIVDKKPHLQIIGKVALRKIDEIKKELGQNYSNVDEPLIVIYAKNYERYLELEKKLSVGILSTSTKTGTEYLSPNFTAILAIQKNLVTIANQLGLSISSRKN